MIDRRTYPRVRCQTKLCWNEGKLDFKGVWQFNDYCEYVEVECSMCKARYWLIKRDRRYSIKDRTDEKFEHRSGEGR